MHSVHFDRRRWRLSTQASGFWDLAEAMAFYTEVTAACRDARRLGRPLTLLSDVTDYLPQAGRVGEVNVRTAAELAETAMDKYAVVAPTALNRMRIRRVMSAVPFEVFTDRESALAWLGWTEDYRRLIARERAPAPPASTTLHTRAA